MGRALWESGRAQWAEHYGIAGSSVGRALWDGSVGGRRAYNRENPGSIPSNGKLSLGVGSSLHKCCQSSQRT